MLLTFTAVNEQRYYSNLTRGKESENVYDHNGFRLSYYMENGFLYCYYMGNYFFCDARIFNNLSETDILNEIIEQCSDPYKIKKDINIEIDIE